MSEKRRPQKDFPLGKSEVIAEVEKISTQARTLVFAQYRGLTVAKMMQLRASGRSAGVHLKVLKNTLVARALSKTQFSVASAQFKGPLIYGFSDDDVAAARVMSDFAKTNELFAIQGGVNSGKLLDVVQVQQLGSIPSKEVLLSQLCGLLKSPITRTAAVLAALANQKTEAAAA